MKYFIISLVCILLMVCSINAETLVFAGGGTDIHAVHNPDNYDIDANLGWSFGFTKSLSDKFAINTIYDYTVTDAVEDGTGDTYKLYENNLFTSVSLLLNKPEDKFHINVLSGVEMTDGNIPDYGTFFSFANGVMLSYKTPFEANILAIGILNLSEDYSSGKVRVGVSYPINFIDGIF